MPAESTVDDIAKFLSKIIPVFAVLAVGVNVFHVVVLTRKTVTSSSMNTLLIGIAVVDILAPIVYVKQGLWWMVTYWQDFCSTSQYPDAFIEWILLTLNDNFRRCSTWLGLMLAANRTISVKLASKRSWDFLTESKFGWRVFLITVFLSSIVSVSYMYRFQIVEEDPRSCITSSGKIVITIRTSVVEDLKEDDDSDSIARQIHLLVTGILGKLVPSFLFPILAVILVCELGKYEGNSNSNSNSNSESTVAKTDKISKMVIYMTISFLIIEFPIGIIRVLNSTQTESSIFSNLNKIFNCFYVPVTMSHCFICFSMSSQYRQTAKRLLGIDKGLVKLTARVATKTPTISIR